MRSARSHLFLLTAVLILFPSCSDSPSDLGLGLVDVKAGEPKSVTLEPSAFKAGDIDISGGYRSFSLSTGRTVFLGATRSLAGKVDDPDLGLMEAEASIDFVQQSSNVTDVFTNGTVSSVTLTLQVDYVYGDTTDSITLRLAEIMDDWNAVDARSDTVITSGPDIVEFSMQPNASSVAVELPAGWVSANDARLRSESFSDDFKGFQISPVEGNAIVGLGQSEGLLEIAVPGDTLKLNVERVHSSLSRITPSAPTEFILLQDGFEALDVELDFEREDLADGSIHDVLFRIDTGSPALSEPTGFVRPRLSLINLVAVTEDSSQERVLLATATVDGAGRITFSDPDLTLAMQNTVRGVGGLNRFELAAPVSLTSLDYMFFKKTPGAGGPRLILTITEVN